MSKEEKPIFITDNVGNEPIPTPEPKIIKDNSIFDKEEEKKAIEILNKNILVDECWKNHDIDQIFKETHIWALKKVLNLIEKQQKEIENKDRLIEQLYNTLEEEM